MNHPIQGLMHTAMENLKGMIDVNTIVGDPIKAPDGSVILTVSKVSFGFAAGGSEFGKNENGARPFGGGSGGGVSIMPVAFLVVNSQDVKVLHLDENTHLVDKVMDMAPQVIDKIKGMMKKDDTSDQQPPVM
ncbi:GerW family sporulation protein [Ectobacillus ponti]|uniref:GerW family sporulation protein n=1 Tax=Ectobacillus ponti TaxID=2961894 RepID=A0AA41X2K0_9BACI|nr:GerW family sporulation protein [Ectobacillus ponti]MCP8967457.1 GerW family sporulation protein [Ectobacillus ponti]